MLTTFHYGILALVMKLVILIFSLSRSSGNASLRDLSKKDSVIKIKCKLKTIDNFRQSHKEPIDFIKIDTEGSELLALKGGINFLNSDKPIIFSEI